MARLLAHGLEIPEDRARERISNQVGAETARAAVGQVRRQLGGCKDTNPGCESVFPPSCRHTVPPRSDLAWGVSQNRVATVSAI
ncbi:Uncharacterised protein [Mycobacteroides abscessus subsp. massiliense]|nr:Uncharacterised protein [Mycobacteroides abscessus subsp. massiliense]SLI98959.1 Uncharacterised protein [Mycobacteroides abscessus subsp. massiliense]